MTSPRLPSFLPSFLLAAVLPLTAHSQPAPPSAAPAKPTAAAPKPAAPKAAPPKPYLTINNIPIPQSTADTFLATLKSRGAPETDELRNAVREEMIRRGLLLAEAKKHALDKTPDYQQRLQDATQTLLMQAAVAKYLPVITHARFAP
jgi:hypothetical protein